MFRTVTKQLRLAGGVVASVGAIAESVAEDLDPRLSSYLDEVEILAGTGTIQIALVRWLEDDHGKLEGFEEGHRKALDELKKLREQRDDEQGVLYGQLLQVRTTFDDAFG